MLKNFKNLKDAQVLSKNEQKAVNGGGICPDGFYYVYRGDIFVRGKLIPGGWSCSRFPPRIV